MVAGRKPILLIIKAPNGATNIQVYVYVRDCVLHPKRCFDDQVGLRPTSLPQLGLGKIMHKIPIIDRREMVTITIRVMIGIKHCAILSVEYCRIM